MVGARARIANMRANENIGTKPRCTVAQQAKPSLASVGKPFAGGGEMHLKFSASDVALRLCRRSQEHRMQGDDKASAAQHAPH